MTYQVRLETVASSQPTAIVRRRAALRELPKVIPEACGIVWNSLRAAGVKGAGRNLAFYLDDAFNLEVGVEMNGPFAGAGEVIPSTLPTGRAVTVTHFGPYHQLPAAHEALRAWCTANGHKLAGPNWEIYGHWQESWNTNPAAIRTDVYYLL